MANLITSGKIQTNMVPIFFLGPRDENVLLNQPLYILKKDGDHICIIKSDENSFTVRHVITHSYYNAKGSSKTIRDQFNQESLNMND